MGYTSKIVEKTYQQIHETPKKKKKNLGKINVNNIMKKEMNQKQHEIEEEAGYLLEGFFVLFFK